MAREEDPLKSILEDIAKELSYPGVLHIEEYRQTPSLSRHGLSIMERSRRTVHTFGPTPIQEKIILVVYDGFHRGEKGKREVRVDVGDIDVEENLVNVAKKHLEAYAKKHDSKVHVYEGIR